MKLRHAGHVCPDTHRAWACHTCFTLLKQPPAPANLTYLIAPLMPTMHSPAPPLLWLPHLNTGRVHKDTRQHSHLYLPTCGSFQLVHSPDSLTLLTTPLLGLSPEPCYSESNSLGRYYLYPCIANASLQLKGGGVYITSLGKFKAIQFQLPASGAILWGYNSIFVSPAESPSVLY